MVETQLTPVQATLAGGDITGSLVTPSAGGNNFVNDGSCYLVIVCGITNTIITMTGQALAYDGQAHNQTSITVYAGNTAYMGPFPRMYFNDVNNLVHFTSSDNASTNVAVVSC